MADILNIAGRIHSTSREEIAVTANEVLDETQGKRQDEINAEVFAKLADTYRKDETFSREELNSIASKTNIHYVNTTVTEEAASAEGFDFYHDVLAPVKPSDEIPADTGVVYRVGRWDGNNAQYDPTKYSVYVLDGNSNPVLIAVIDQAIDLITNEEMDDVLGGELPVYLTDAEGNVITDSEDNLIEIV